MGGGKKGKYTGGHSNGYSNDRGSSGLHEAQRKAMEQEREWEREMKRDRALGGEGMGDRDVWDERPTFKIIPRLEDNRPLEELEQLLVEAEEKYDEMDAQLEDKDRMEREAEQRRMTVNQEIDACQKEKEQKQQDINVLVENSATMKQLNQTIQNKIKAIIEDKEAIREQKKKKYRELGFGGKNPTTEDITKAIKDVEYEMETKSNLSKRTELDLMKKIRKLQAARDGLRDQQRLQDKIHEKDEDIKLCKKEIEGLHAERAAMSKKEEAIKMKIAQISKKINGLRRELQHCGPRDLLAARGRQDDLVNLLTHKVGYRSAKNRYTEALEHWVEEKDRHLASRKHLYDAADEARKAELEERRKEMEARKENPWVEEKRACNELIEYVDELCKERIKEKPNGVKAEEEGEEKEEKEGDEESDGEKDNEKEAEEEEDELLRHDGHRMADFNLIRIQVPTSVKALKKAAIQLKNRLRWLETAAWDARIPEANRRGGRGGGFKGGKGGRGGKGGKKGGKGWKGGKSGK